MFRRALRRFVHNKTAMTALIIFLLLVASCIVFPLLGFTDYSELHLESQYAPVSWRHPFSTDNLGRDVFTRIVIGGRYTLGLSFIATAVAVVFGTLIALISAYRGGWLDQAVVGVSQAISAVPYVLIVIIIEVSLGWGKGYYALAVGLANMPAVIAAVRAAVLKVRQREFISAARVAGKSDLYIVIFHVVACSVLGYLEIGISSPTPEWGRMVADNFHLITTRGYLVFIPCLFISVSVLCVTMISHGLRDALDPKEYQHD